MRAALLPLAAFAVLVARAVSSTAEPEPAPGLPRLVRTIPLPDVKGRIDHLATDAAERRLVVAALGNDSVEVIDLEQGRVVKSLKGLPEPQGIAILPGSGRIAVTCGGDGTLRFFEPERLEPAGTVAVGSDADNLRAEAASGRLVVGYGDGGLALVQDGRVTSRVALSAHPESFQLAAKDGRAFVNVPGAGHVAVADLRAGRVTATWALSDARANFPMALDEEHQRLLVGCRDPARLLLFDTTPGAVGAGKPLDALPISGDVDDVWIDAATQRIYLSCGAGFLDVVERADGDHLRLVSRVPTAAGARTSLPLPRSSRLCVAVPRRGAQPAEVRVFALK